MKHQVLMSVDHRIIVWFLACALSGLVLGLRYAASEERTYRSQRNAARSGRRREETVYVLTNIGGN